MTEKGFDIVPPLDVFLFETPLYAKYLIKPDEENSFKILWGQDIVDGYCPQCKQNSTYVRAERGVSFESLSNGNHRYIYKCTRNKGHLLHIYIDLLRITQSSGIIQKIGQNPSVADLNKNMARSFRHVTSDTDMQELVRAIGLSAHGIGIGSYVYLRRIFERIILEAYFQKTDRMPEGEFMSMRMGDRINYLSGDLPAFLVENKKIYGILSAGLHELDENQCLEHYEILFESIIYILEERKESAEKAQRLKSIARKIQSVQLEAKPDDEG